MAINANWPNYDAAYPHCVMISPRRVPGGPWPDHPWLDRGTLWLDWEHEIMIIRDWCWNNLQGPWVFLSSRELQIYTQLAEDHALVQLTWQ